MPKHSKCLKFTVSLFILASLLTLSATAKVADSLVYVFIFKSKSTKNDDFYQAAYNYYQAQQISNDNLVVVRNVGSLEEVINILNRKASQKLVSKITIVTHASQWSGLNIPIKSNIQSKTSFHEIQEYLNKDSRAYVNDNILREDATINIDGCGIGRNTLILNTLSGLFTSKDNIAPKVLGAEGFVYYYHTASDSTPPKFHRYEVPIYEVIYPYSKSSTIKEKIDKLKSSHNKSIDWSRALESSYNHLKSNAYTSRERVVTISSYGYKDDILNFSSLQDYLKKHNNIRVQLTQFNSKVDDFSWKLTKVSDDDIVRITGKATVITILDSSNLISTL